MSTERTGPRSVASAALLAVLATAVMMPAIVAAVAVVRPQWYPTGDLAQAELHVRGFWSHPPLVGAAGRIESSTGVQGSHPGPLLWLALWPLYAIGGSTSTSLVASVVVVHVLTAALALWLAWRRAGWTFALVLAAVLAIVSHAGGPELFTEPWNPWMGLLPFLVMLLAAWTVLDGERWALVVAVAAGTYSVQSHAGYVLVVGGLLALLVGTVAWRAWRTSRDAPPGRGRVPLGWLAIAALTALVLWVPAVVDQVRRHPGNLWILWDHFTDPDAPYLGVAKVAEVALTQFNLLGPWMLGRGRDGTDVAAVAGCIGFVVLWTVAIRAAWRRRASSELHLHVVLAVVAVLAVASISRIFGVYLEYTVRWVWLIAGTVVAASVLSLLRSHPVPTRWRRVAAIGGIAVATVGLVVASLQFADRAGPTGVLDSRMVAGLIGNVESRLERDTPYLVRWSDPGTLGATGFGMVLELERRGFHVGVDPEFATAALPHRVLPEGSAGAVLYVVTGAPSIARTRSLADVVELASVDVRTPEARARSDELRGELEGALAASGHADQIPLLDDANGQARLLFADPPLPDAVRGALQEYVSIGLPTAVFVAPPFVPVLTAL